MRLFALVFAVLFLRPLAGQSLDELRLTADFSDTPLLEAIAHLEKKLGLLFSFPQEAVVGKRVSCSFREADWTAISQCLFAAWDLDAIAQKAPYVSLRPVASSQERNWQLCIEIKAADGTPLPFAPLGFPGRAAYFSTDEAGRYVGVVTAAGNELLSVQYLGYTSQTLPLRQLVTGDCAIIFLPPATVELAAVIVSEYLTEGVSATADGRRVEFDPARMPAVPGFTDEEVYRSLSLLPGVNNLNETAGDLSIRGGARDQNLVLWDGIPVYTAGHYFGMISNFTPELIDKVSVWRGQGEAAYGGRVAGIVSFETDREVSPVFRAGASLDLLSAGGFAKIPLLKNRSDVHLGFRTSLPGLLPGPTYQGYREQVFQANAFERLLEAENEGAETFDFQEYNGRWRYNIGEGHSLTVSGFRQRNDFSYLLRPGERRFFGERITVLSSGYSINYERPVGAGAITVQAAHTDYANAGQSGFQLGERNRVSSRRESELRESSLRLAYTQSGETGGKVTAGVQLQRYDQRLDYFYDNRLSDSIRQITDPAVTALAGAAYGSYDWAPTAGPFRASIGLRLQYYGPTQRIYPEPRLNGSYRINDNWLVKAAYGENHQFPLEVIQLNPPRVSGTLPLWLLADGERVEVPTAREVSTGFTGQSGSWLFDLEAYHKGVENISSLNTTIRGREYTNGTSRSFGLDLLVRKRWKNWRAWLIYSLSRTDWRFPTISSGGFFPADNDRRHQLRLMGSWQHERWSFTAGWRLHSGQRYTDVEDVALRGLSVARLLNGPANEAVLPVYHRLDASAFYVWTPKSNRSWRGELGVSLLNIYGRENYLERRFLVQDTGQSFPNRFVPTAFDKVALGFTPNFTIRLAFR